MDWKRLAKRLLLANRTISELETAILMDEILADRVVDRAELEFLQELRREASAVHADFDRFFFQVVKRVVLTDGKISDAEARWLRQTLLREGKVSPAEKQFLQELRREAKAVGPEFESLCDEFLKD